MAKVIRVVNKNLTNYAIYRKYYCVEKSWFTSGETEPCSSISNKKDILLIPKKQSLNN